MSFLDYVVSTLFFVIGCLLVAVLMLVTVYNDRLRLSVARPLPDEVRVICYPDDLDRRCEPDKSRICYRVKTERSQDSVSTTVWQRDCTCASSWTSPDLPDRALPYPVEERVLFCAESAGPLWRKPERVERWAGHEIVDIELVQALIDAFDTGRGKESGP